jgi:hypothetical protein
MLMLVPTPSIALGLPVLCHTSVSTSDLLVGSHLGKSLELDTSNCCTCYARQVCKCNHQHPQVYHVACGGFEAQSYKHVRNA